MILQENNSHTTPYNYSLPQYPAQAYYNPQAYTQQYPNTYNQYSQNYLTHAPNLTRNQKMQKVKINVQTTNVEQCSFDGELETYN